MDLIQIIGNSILKKINYNAQIVGDISNRVGDISNRVGDISNRVGDISNRVNITNKNPNAQIVGDISNRVNITNKNPNAQIVGDISNRVNITNKNPNANTLRNGCIQQINNVLQSFNQIYNNINNINSIINVFKNIINILENIPIPTSVPPGVGVPLSVINKITLKIINFKKIINSLSTIVNISDNIINELIQSVNEERSRLKEIDGNNIDKENYTNNFLGEIKNTSYKGFKFFIKEEKNSNFKIKRKYAVAIDTKGFERVVSEYSFTLEPNVLVEMLKIEIDNLNLKG